MSTTAKVAAAAAGGAFLAPKIEKFANENLFKDKPLSEGNAKIANLAYHAAGAVGVYMLISKMG